MKVTEFNERKKFSESSGVTAYADDGLSMRLNEFGIYEEVVIQEGKSEISPMVSYISPIFNTETNESIIAHKLFSQHNGIQFDERVGYYLSLYAGHVTEGDYREHGSSGGMGTWILTELFNRKMIDAVIHVKMNSDPNDQVLFRYDISRSVDEIRAGAKTKYYPVEMSQVLKLVKENPGRYAIIGIPSFIMSIRLLAEKDDVIRERIKYTVGLICGHQKSSKFSEALAWQVGIKPGNLEHIDFRKKMTEGPANQYGVEFVGYINGKITTIIKPKHELLGQDWGQGFFKQMASDFTDDVFNETADIALGDAWMPEYNADHQGNNIIAVRNPEIDKLVKVGRETGKLILDEVDIQTIFLSQSSHYKHTHDELSYRLYKKDILGEWRPKKRVAPSKRISLLRRRVQDLREEISMQSHILYKEAVEMDNLNHFIRNMNILSKKYKGIYKLLVIHNKGLKGIAQAIGRRIFSKIK